MIPDCFDAPCKLGLFGIFAGLKPVRYKRVVRPYLAVVQKRLETARENNRDRRERLALAGKCYCGSPAVRNLSRCQECRDIESGRRKVRQLNRSMGSGYDG